MWAITPSFLGYFKNIKFFLPSLSPIKQRKIEIFFYLNQSYIIKNMLGRY